MGTILQLRTSSRNSRGSITDRELRKVTIDDNVTRSKMGRRQTVSSTNNSLQPQNAVPSQESTQSVEKRLQQSRRRHQPPTTKQSSSYLSYHGKTDSKSLSALASGNLQEDFQQRRHREHKLPGSQGARHTPDPPRHQFKSMLDLNASNLETNKQCKCEDTDSGSDISESERLPISLSSCTPPQLNLRPEVINPDDLTSHSQRQRVQSHNSFLFPDFLPPPFNSWSLSQLAVFFNMEGRVAARPRAVGPLERYLERLLQLEWRQIQTVQDESGKSGVSDVLTSSHRPHAAAAARLSSPKSILQCQRAFPLTFLSSLANHSTLLSGCACSLCRLRYSTCTMTCCHSSLSHTRQSRLSPVRSPVSFLPKRSYSESRVPSSDRKLAHPHTNRAQRFASPVKGNSHLKRMQAFGNIRNPAKSSTSTPHSTFRDSSVGAERKLGCSEGGDVLSGEYRPVGSRMRSGSEHRKGGSERWRNGSDGRRIVSESRKGGSERKRATRPENQQIKPDDVISILNNIPAGPKDYKIRQNRLKQVEFVT